MRTRAYRRFIERKFKKKTKEFLKIYLTPENDLTDRLIGIMTNSHRKICSCWMCSKLKSSNRAGRIKLSDKRSNIDFNEQLIDNI